MSTLSQATLRQTAINDALAHALKAGVPSVVDYAVSVMQVCLPNPVVSAESAQALDTTLESGIPEQMLGRQAGAQMRRQGSSRSERSQLVRHAAARTESVSSVPPLQLMSPVYDVGGTPGPAVYDAARQDLAFPLCAGPAPEQSVERTASPLSDDILQKRAREYLTLCIDKQQSISSAALRLLVGWDKARIQQEAQAMIAAKKTASVVGCTPGPSVYVEPPTAHTAGAPLTLQTTTLPKKSATRTGGQGKRRPMSEEARQKLRDAWVRRKAAAQAKE